MIGENNNENTKGSKVEYEKFIDVYSFGVIFWEMISKTDSPQNHQFNKYQIDNKEIEIPSQIQKTEELESKIESEKITITLPLDKIDKIFHSILKSSLCLDPTKRERFDEILEYLVDSYIQIANIP